MAQKRMFTMKIVDSDAFLDLPLSSQCLYFHLNMRADDDGFVGNPKKIMRMIGASEDDLKLLIVKRFLIVFENNIVVIKHWWMHNTLIKDRYHETAYLDEKQELLIKDNKSYSVNEGLPVNKMLTDCKQNANRNLDLNLDLNLDKDINLNSKAIKHKFGEYKNVLLTDSEYNRLVETYGKEKADAAINHFSELKEMKGYKYKSDNLALKKWGIKSYEDSKSKCPNYSKPNNSFDMGDRIPL